MLTKKEMIDRAVRIAWPVFANQGWTWYDSNETPTRKKMKETLEYLWEEAEKNKTYCSTGRFMVQYDKEDGSIDIFLQLAGPYSQD